jgi:hypothetical protein
MPVQRLHPLHGHFYLYSVHTAYLSKRLLMRVLVIGSNGRMCRLYAAIVRYLGHEVAPHDTDTGPIPNRAKYEKAIIATPIDSHYEYCKWLAERKCDFLCEKPISKNVDEVREIACMCDLHTSQTSPRMYSTCNSSHCHYRFFTTYELCIK